MLTSKSIQIQAEKVFKDTMWGKSNPSVLVCSAKFPNNLFIDNDDGDGGISMTQGCRLYEYLEEATAFTPYRFIA